MAFEGLSEKLNSVFKGLRGKGRLTEEDIKLAMREVRMALLEADVSYKSSRTLSPEFPSAPSAPRCSTASPPPSRSSRSSTRS